RYCRQSGTKSCAEEYILASGTFNWSTGAASSKSGTDNDVVSGAPLQECDEIVIILGSERIKYPVSSSKPGAISFYNLLNLASQVFRDPKQASDKCMGYD